MKFPLPLQIPQGGRPIITQPYGVTQNTLEPVGPNGEPHFHWGVDIVLGSDHDTFGGHLRCPFPSATIETYDLEPQGTQNISPYVQLRYRATDGTLYECILVHVSEMEPPKTFQYGDLVAKIGNIGLVAPVPNLRDPYAGAHLHLGFKVNRQYVDPEQYFDFSQWFSGPGPTQEDALPATNWLVKELLALVKAFQPSGD